MDSVAGARRTPGRLKTGGVPPKPPATILLSLWPSMFLGLRIVVQDVADSFLTRCCGSRIFVHITAETSALCRGTSQQNIAFQMFLQLQTLRRHVSRPVAAGVSPSPQDVAASQCVCSRGADDGRCSHICEYPGVAVPLASAGCRGNFLRVVDDRLGKIVLPFFIYSRLCFPGLREVA